jgi:type III secretion protein J
VISRPSAKRLCSSLLLVALASGGLAGSGCDAELYRDLSERRVNEALLALREAGLAGDKRLDQRGGAGRAPSFALVVARSDETRALALLAQRSLPRPVERSAGPSSRLLFSPTEQRTESAAAMAAAVAETLERLPEVIEARVHLALPESEPLSPLGSLRPTASVLLRLRAPLPLQPGEVAELVARAVPGLDAHDVAVVRALAPPLAAAAAVARSAAAEPRPLTLALYGGLLLLLAGAALLLGRATVRRPPPPRPERLGRSG